MELNIERELSFARLAVIVKQFGADYCIELQGGEQPHIGCVVLSIPRPSLKRNGEISVTSSVINVTGHKDEQICRYLSEQLTRCKNAVVVCTGGFHVDDIDDGQLQEILESVKDIGEEIKEKLG